MQPHRQRYAFILLVFILSIGLVFVWTTLMSKHSAVRAATSVDTTIRYVSPEGNDSGTDCTNSNDPCASLQYSVDVSNPGDEIRAAIGIYTGSQVITNSLGYTYTQVVYIDKDLTLRGGYTNTNWVVSDPTLNPSVIDADGYGRGITIIGTGDEIVTIDGFTITNGDYTGLGSQTCHATGSDCGGGIFVYLAGFHLLNSNVMNNTVGDNPSDGGGINLWYALTSRIENTVIQGNSATEGGGLLVFRQTQPLTILGCTFQENTAEWIGGGIDLSTNIESLIAISNTQFLTNTVKDGEGGGMYARLTDDGLILQMDRVVFQGNQASERGKAIMIDTRGIVKPKARLTNLLLTGNADYDSPSTDDDEAVIALGPDYDSLEITLAHLTVADNLVPTFLHTENSPYSFDNITVTLTNTLVSGFTNAYAAGESGNGQVALQHTNTLLHNVTNIHVTLVGSPTITSTAPILGNPMLDQTYHLQVGSDAIDAGVEAGVSFDIDGDPRPIGYAPDIGADETTIVSYTVYIPLVQK